MSFNCTIKIVNICAVAAAVLASTAMGNGPEPIPFPDLQLSAAQRRILNQGQQQARARIAELNRLGFAEHSEEMRAATRHMDRVWNSVLTPQQRLQVLEHDLARTRQHIDWQRRTAGLSGQTRGGLDLQRMLERGALERTDDVSRLQREIASTREQIRLGQATSPPLRPVRPEWVPAQRPLPEPGSGARAADSTGSPPRGQGSSMGSDTRNLSGANNDMTRPQPGRSPTSDTRNVSGGNNGAPGSPQGSSPPSDTRNLSGANSSTTRGGSSSASDTRNLRGTNGNPTGGSPASDTGRVGNRSGMNGPEPGGPRSTGSRGAGESSASRRGLGTAEEGLPSRGLRTGGGQGGSRTGGGLDLEEDLGRTARRAGNLLGNVVRGAAAAAEVQQFYDGLTRFIRNKEQNEVIGAALNEINSQRGDLERQFARHFPEVSRNLAELANLPREQLDRLLDRRTLGDADWRAARQMVDQLREHNQNEAAIRNGIQNLIDRRRENLNPLAPDRETGAFRDLSEQLRRYVPGEVDRYEAAHSEPAEALPTTYFPRLPFSTGNSGNGNTLTPAQPTDATANSLRRMIAEHREQFPQGLTDDELLAYALANIRRRGTPFDNFFQRPPERSQPPAPVDRPPDRVPPGTGGTGTGGTGTGSTGNGPAETPPYLPPIQRTQTPVNPPANTTAQDRYRQQRQAYEQWLRQREAYHQWQSQKQAYERWLAQQSAEHRNSHEWLARQDQYRRWQAYQQAYRRWLSQQQQYRRWQAYLKAYREWQARQRAHQQQLAHQRALAQWAAQQQASQIARRASQQTSRGGQTGTRSSYGPSRSLGIVPDSETMRRRAAR